MRRNYSLRLIASNPNVRASPRPSSTFTRRLTDISSVREMLDGLRVLLKNRPDQAAGVVELVKDLARAANDECTRTGDP
jgi:hypothetical protein